MKLLDKTGSMCRLIEKRLCLSTSNRGGHGFEIEALRLLSEGRALFFCNLCRVSSVM
jgi:hypothetical protein